MWIDVSKNKKNRRFAVDIEKLLLDVDFQILNTVFIHTYSSVSNIFLLYT